MPKKEFTGFNAAEEAFAWWRSEEGMRCNVSCFAAGPDKDGGKNVLFIFDLPEEQVPPATQNSDTKQTSAPPQSVDTDAYHEPYGHKPAASCSYDLPPAAK